MESDGFFFFSKYFWVNSSVWGFSNIFQKEFFHLSLSSFSLSFSLSSSLFFSLSSSLFLSSLLFTHTNGSNHTSDSINEERPCSTIHWVKRELSICQSLLAELTRHVTLPTENSHAAPPVESKKSCESVNPYSKSEAGEFHRVESNRAASSTPGWCQRRPPPKLGQHWLPSHWSFDPILSASDGTGEKREDKWTQHWHKWNGCALVTPSSGEPVEFEWNIFILYSRESHE